MIHLALTIAAALFLCWIAAALAPLLAIVFCVAIGAALVFLLVTAIIINPAVAGLFAAGTVILIVLIQAATAPRRAASKRELLLQAAIPTVRLDGRLAPWQARMMTRELARGDSLWLDRWGRVTIFTVDGDHFTSGTSELYEPTAGKISWLTGAEFRTWERPLQAPASRTDLFTWRSTLEWK